MYTFQETIGEKAIDHREASVDSVSGSEGHNAIREACGTRYINGREMRLRAWFRGCFILARLKSRIRSDRL